MSVGANKGLDSLGALLWPGLQEQMRAVDLGDRDTREPGCELMAEACADDSVARSTEIEDRRGDVREQGAHIGRSEACEAGSHDRRRYCAHGSDG